LGKFTPNFITPPLPIAGQLYPYLEERTKNYSLEEEGSRHRVWSTTAKEYNSPAVLPAAKEVSFWHPETFYFGFPVFPLFC
jgi:hypothetical protein